MSFAGTAVAVGASVAGSVASGAMASGAAGQSAKDVKNAAFKGEMKTYENLVDATKNLTPWIGSGVAAQGLVDIGLGLNGVSDADIRKAEEDVRTWQTKLEEIKALKVKKKNIDEKYARIAQYNKS